MCKYCDNKSTLDILNGEIGNFNDVCLFGMEPLDTITYKELQKYFSTNKIKVFYDRGHLRLTEGEDIECLDHSLNQVRINYCPMCGREIWEGVSTNGIK